MSHLTISGSKNWAIPALIEKYKHAIYTALVREDKYLVYELRQKAKKLGLHFNLHVLPDGTLIIGDIRYEH